MEKMARQEILDFVDNPLGIAGRGFVVTGGSRGLGREIVQLLAAAGARVATCARTEDDLRALQKDVAADGGRLYTEALDVTEPAVLEAFVDRAADRFGRLDGVVACAGGARGASLGDAETADWAATFAINVLHTQRLLKTAAPHLSAAGGGSAVLISSINGWKPAPRAQYGAAKAALISMAGSLANELGPQGIRVNAVSPGSMLIPGRRWARMRAEEPDAFARFAAQVPSGELVTPQEVARVVAFLLSRWSSGMTGAHVVVDRGQNSPTPEGY
ncbi:SDR family NAD(P)-dependent oxidoreductase [Streptomyces sp. NPDC059788]|uniref:SDR family NAD(P)-dependent oxidoreductase n=1 Tax=Streptomyces sp. NPDC059788 TaxID=3346948 RepID=UPI00365F881B